MDPQLSPMEVASTSQAGDLPYRGVCFPAPTLFFHASGSPQSREPPEALSAGPGICRGLTQLTSRGRGGGRGRVLPRAPLHPVIWHQGHYLFRCHLWTPIHWKFPVEKGDRAG